MGAALGAWLVGKTFKREVAVIALLFWGVVTYKMVWDVPEPRLIALAAVYAAQTWATWTFAAAAFGMHALSTQWGKR